MNWLPTAKVGDRFRWRGDGTVCRITEIDECDIYFMRETGDWAGQRGYTTVPQDVELLSAVDQLGNLARDGGKT